MRIAAVSGVIFVLAGCSYYRPLATTTPAPGMAVSIALTELGSDSLARYLGPDVGDIRGRLLSMDDSSYMVSVSGVDLRHGLVLGWKGERVVVARSLVGGLAERRFSLGRSLLVGGLSALGFVVSVEAFKAVDVGSAPGGGGGKPR